MLKKNLSVFLFVLLLAGLFWSRAMLSITVTVWSLIAFVQIFKTDKSFFKKPLFKWALVPLLLWFLGAWQEPMGHLNYDYLLTLIAYPAILLIVQATPVNIVAHQWLRIILYATALAIAYPLFWYIKDFVAIHKAYGSGQSLPTFMDSDHVRFSIYLCCVFLLILTTELLQKKSKYLLGTILFFFILFLAVRTGWVLLISIICIYAAFVFSQTKKRKMAQLILGACALIVAVSISYFSFPNMQQKMAYSIWEYQEYKVGMVNPNFSDGTRRTLNEAALQYLQNNRFTNTGWQSVSSTLQNALLTYFNYHSTEFGWPFNQWLYWWMGSGWWGMLLFSIWLLYPILPAFKQKNWGIICWTVAITLSCMVETTLNYQYGVLLHVLPIAILWKIYPTSESDNS